MRQEIEQLKEQYLSTDTLLEQTRADVQNLQQQEQDKRFQDDWNFTLELLENQSRTKKAQSETEAKLSELQVQLDPYLILEAKEYQRLLIERDEQRPLVEKYHSMGKITDSGLANFNRQNQELRLRATKDRLLRRGIILLSEIPQEAPTVVEPPEPPVEPQEPIEPTPVPFPNALDLAKQVKLTPLEYEIYGLIRFAKESGGNIDIDQMVDLIYQDHPEVQNKKHNLHKAIRDLITKSAAANIAITNIGGRKSAIYDLKFINPPAEPVVPSQTPEEPTEQTPDQNLPTPSLVVFDSKAFFDSVETGLQQPLIDFFQSSDFTQLLTSAENFFGEADWPWRFPKFLNCAFGFTVESLAYPFTQIKMQELYGHSVFVVPPKQTFKIYHNLFPDNGYDSFFGLQDVIRGISIPDGLILNIDTSSNTEQTQILGLCEFTSANFSSSPGKMSQIDRLLYQRNYVLRDLDRIFNPNHTQHSAQALNYFQEEYPTLPTQYSLPRAEDLEIFFTILRDTADIPGADLENVFRMPFTSYRLARSLETILNVIQQNTEAGSNVDPRIFLPN